ncbi:ArnT family glycosyltransferase [Urechidicola croceus]|uniref:Glycosyltransferase RgtA/B/C/D-like domain-containing protein n=1 Tax=Urechidicola croceus TaxID=1850246 RepID=A0A1D8P8N6_9FLAO|nr:glycosyltransferase family 39 protein [Urechidicola croceus]AOW20946.1 hypothetical protein LPB138_09790 [Urechidicola croceus]
MILQKINYKLLYILILIPYLIGLFIPLMELDSAQHATMAMRMYYENDFFNIIKSHQPYLDKPHMHYWLAAISFKIFGVSEFSYRLPAFCFLLLGALSTFKLGKLLYNKDVGHIASLIFLSSQTIILSAHDVRTDAVLTGSIIFSLWKLISYFKTSKIVDIFFGFLFLGIAFNTKGLIAVVAIGLYIFSYLIYERNWKSIFNWKIGVGIFTFLLAIFPVLYAYYNQFDMHPELLVKGQKNVSGVKFILWDQVFNRLNAVGFEKTSPDYFFFFHTLLWAFIPFSLIGYIAIFNKIKFFIKIKFRKVAKQEFLTLGGFLSVILLISFSKFKLPHYLNILIPILSILTASFLVQLFLDKKEKYLKALLIIQYIIVGVLVLAVVYLSIFTFKISNWFLVIISVLGVFGLFYLAFQKRNYFTKIILLSVVAAAWINFNLNALFYPKLLKYQGGLQLAEIVVDKQIPIEKIYLLKETYNWSFDFYTKKNTKHISVEDLEKQNDIWLVVDEVNFKQIKEKVIDIQDVISVRHFPVTRLSGKFLNKKTRDKVLTNTYLIKL